MTFQTIGMDSNGKHVSEKVTLTVESTQLCVKAHLGSQGTHWQSQRLKHGCEHSHHISVLVTALLKMEA